jgi:tRNA(Ile)-lysidine synthase
LRIERRVAAYVAAQAVLRPGERLLLLLSGGADSMALLAILPSLDRRLGLGLELAALHVDYATRGAESDRDRRIVEDACAAACVPLHVVKLRRRLTGGDFQARARDVRYERARGLAGEHGYDVVVTAHNRDDQAETILYRLAKYASPRGLLGMRGRDGDLARPLLCLGAAEIRDYCRARKIAFGDDFTNAQPVYARNRLRLDVLPRLEELNPRVAETLAAAALQAAAEADVLSVAVEEARARVTVPGPHGEGGGSPGEGGGARIAALPAVAVEALAAEPPALRALVAHDLLKEAMGAGALVERRLVEAVLELAARPGAGGRVSLGRGLEAVRERDRVRLTRVRVPHRCPEAGVDGAALAAAGGEGVSLAFCGRTRRARLSAGAVFDRDAARAGQAFIGLSAVPRRVTLRHPRRGERFAPLGLGSETTVARYLARARVSSDAREHAVVLDVDGAVAWVGHDDGAPVGRVAQGFRVAQSSSNTVHVFQEGP